MGGPDLPAAGSWERLRDRGQGLPFLQAGQLPWPSPLSWRCYSPSVKDKALQAPHPLGVA